MSAPPDDIESIAERLGFPIPEAYRDSVAQAFARLLEQAALVMAAEVPGDGGGTDFVP